MEGFADIILPWIAPAFLGAIAAAGIAAAARGRFRTPLGREIVLALSIKAMALLALWGLFFSPAHRVNPDADTLERVFVGSPMEPDPPQPITDRPPN